MPIRPLPTSRTKCWPNAAWHACTTASCLKDLLACLGVTKQAINIPLRQLMEMDLVEAGTAEHDKRVKELRLTEEGRKLEEALHREQARLLLQAFGEAGQQATEGWLKVNQVMARPQS